jgi:type I restriction enzyme S subunit
VKFSELKGAGRIDATRYQPKFLALEDKLRYLKSVKPLGPLIRHPVTTGQTPKERELVDDGERVYFIKTDTLREGSIIFENADYLPSTSLVKSDYLQTNDVLVTIIGATFDVVGRAAIFTEGYPASTVNQNIAIIRTDENALNPFFLSVFLNSKYGREQLWMLSRQTEQVNLNCREVEEVLVPEFSKTFQEKIQEQFEQSMQALSDSKKVFQQAQTTLLRYLGLESFKPSRTLTFTGKFSETTSATRIDPEYYQPHYKVITQKVAESPSGQTPLLAYAESIPNDFTPSNYPDETFSYVELADIEPSVGVIHSTNQVSGLDAPTRAGRKINTNDILASRVEGSLKQVALVRENNSGALASTGFFQLRATKIEPEVLLVIAKSIIMQAQLKREATGTILTSVPSQALEKIWIPLLPRSVQKDLKELVRESHQDWERGNMAFVNAKNATDLAVDEGEETALAYLKQRS